MSKCNGLFQDKELQNAMEAGVICCICEKLTAEEYGRPGACEDCGGDFVLEEKAND
jgi:uncharacterized CHY-type Zn-finger protein